MLASDLKLQIDSLGRRIEALTGLRELAGERADQVFAPGQWRAIEASLFADARCLGEGLTEAARRFLASESVPGAAHRCGESLGMLEIRLAAAYGTFDTFADIITQRLSPRLGPMLSDCDALARDVLKRDVAALARVADPVVYCDRGFGAATLREGMPLADGRPNPLPLIQVPYTRLAEPLHLTSVIHEAGHEMAVRLGLLPTFCGMARRRLARTGADESIGELFAFWMSELVPDFIGFCAAGLAQPASIREILALAHNEVFRLDRFDPHPPPWLRVLMAFAWCRAAWGRGPWDEWEAGWLARYPQDVLKGEKRSVLSACRKALPGLAETMLDAPLRVLGGRRLSALYGTTSEHPQQLGRRPTETQRTPLRNCRALHVLRSASEYASPHDKH